MWLFGAYIRMHLLLLRQIEFTQTAIRTQNAHVQWHCCVPCAKSQWQWVVNHFKVRLYFYISLFSHKQFCTHCIILFVSISVNKNPSSSQNDLSFEKIKLSKAKPKSRLKSQRTFSLCLFSIHFGERDKRIKVHNRLVLTQVLLQYKVPCLRYELCASGAV